MFEETYQISRELTEQLLHQMYHPNADEIKRNNEALEKARQTMQITRDCNGAVVEFDDLDLSFLNEPAYLSGGLATKPEDFIQIGWESEDVNTWFLLGKRSFSAA